MMDIYAEGKKVRLTGTFTTSAGVAQDPTTVKVAVETPSGTTTTYTYGTDAGVIKSGTGVYYIDVDTTGEPGVWYYRWYATGTGQTATTYDHFRVREARPA